MGKKVEKSLKGEKNQSAISQDEEDPNKTPGNHSNQISPQQAYVSYLTKADLTDVLNSRHLIIFLKGGGGVIKILNNECCD